MRAIGVENLLISRQWQGWGSFGVSYSQLDWFSLGFSDQGFGAERQIVEIFVQNPLTAEMDRLQYGAFIVRMRVIL
jgi:hypothetical protein